jgi:HEAT repeat protein
MAQVNRFLMASVLVVLLSPAIAGQRQPASRPGAMGVEEATSLAQGWTLLARGLAQEAAAHASRVLAENPRSGAALILAVEIEISKTGALAGLAQYERWLGHRTMEEPAVLRCLALATLREIATERQDPTARIEALRGLIDEGEAGAAGELAQAASKGGGAETRALASLGDERAVKILIAELSTEPGDRVTTIDALGASGNPLAVAPLVERLDNPRPEVRGAAVAALGKLGDPKLVPRITPMLSDGNLYVRVNAAGALFRLHDYTGLPLLQELMLDPSPSSRLAAAEATASSPDPSWIALVRELTSAPDLEIRAAAGRLIAPYDPELSLRVLESLAADQNPAIREMASRGLGEVVTSDLTTLRRLMKTTDRLTRVRAAVHVLALTK